MAVTALVPVEAQRSLLNAEIDFDTDTIKVALTTSAYVFDQDTHRYFSSVTNEVVGTGYTAGGATLASKTVTTNTGANTVTLDCADPSWPGSTLTARKAVFYKDTGVAATSPILDVWDFGVDVSSVSAPFLLEIATTGLLVLDTP